MGERRGTRGLELWCKKMTEGYPGVKIENMTTSWRDGLAFCAIIHHFRPDLIDFSKLNKDDIYGNNELAFTVAEQHLGIPALLEPEDMVEFPVPDRLSILTYLSQFYQTFVVSQGSPSRIVPKRPSSATERSSVVSPSSTSPPTKVAALRGTGSLIRREPCAVCNLPVFLAQRLNIGKQLFHRTCFRCARCNSQLTVANYYETENAEFCCETCPDEESSKESVLARSLSDEDKSASLKKLERDDDYSTTFETAIEESSTSEESLEYTRARSQFMKTQIEESDSGNEDEAPSLPEGGPPNAGECDVNSGFPADDKCSLVTSDYSGSIQPCESARTEDFSTKESPPRDGGESISYIKARMRLFEGIIKTERDTGNKVPLVDVDASERSPLTPIESVVDGKQSPKLEESETSIILISDSSEEPSTKLTSDSIIIISDESNPSETPLPLQTVEELPEIQNETTPDDGEYPDDLNPFGDEDEPKTPPRTSQKPSDYDTSLNPFGSEDESEDESKPSPKPRMKKIHCFPRDVWGATPDPIYKVYTTRESFNPFDCAEDQDEVKNVRKVVAAPRVSMSPVVYAFEGSEKPVPKPRNSGKSIDESSDTSSLRRRKKKLAPKPPIFGETADSPLSSLTSSPSQSVQHSPRATPKFLKSKKAPPPPTSTPFDLKQPQDHKCAEISPIPTKGDAVDDDDWQKEKSTKDERNRSKQRNTVEFEDGVKPPNKSTFGQWKRKKGKAPARPIAQRRATRALSVVEIRRELDIIEIQQRGLEKQGVRLEQIIRDKSEMPDLEPDAVNPEIEDMILQLFELVNLKNELFRKQAELMYLRRQQRLEEEHADVEYQIRCLMLQPEAQKTDSDKAKEEELIKRLVEIVERRDEIVNCLELDRVREAEEDDSISCHMNMYTLKREEGLKTESDVEKSVKKEKKKHKKKFIRIHKIDADKDVDESESFNSLSSGKDKKKKKFNIF